MCKILSNLTRLRTVTVRFMEGVATKVYIGLCQQGKVRFTLWQVKCRKLFGFALLFLMASSAVGASDQAIDFDGEEQLHHSAWIDVARRFQLRPTLLYAIALAESGIERLPGTMSPWPYTIRTPDSRYYADTAEEGRAVLNAMLEVHGKNIDVGMGQINLRWNGHRVEDYGDLFDPLTNLEKLAEILKEALDSTKEEAVGVGRYHTWRSREASRSHGLRILAIEEAIIPILGWDQ